MKWLFNNTYVKTCYLLASMAYAQANQLSTQQLFDPLFPATPFKKVLASCMKIRTITHILQDYHDSSFDAELLLDSIIGRITFLNIDLETMLTNSSWYKSTDIEYLLNILDYMIAEINHVIKESSHEQTTNIMQRISVIKNKLHAALESA